MVAISRLYKIGLGVAELFFSVPILGAAVIISHAWTPLGVLFILHVIGLIFSILSGKSKSGHIFGMIGNTLAFIPFVGMFLHFLIGSILVYQGLRNK